MLRVTTQAKKVYPVNGSSGNLAALELSLNRAKLLGVNVAWSDMETGFVSSLGQRLCRSRICVMEDKVYKIMCGLFFFLSSLTSCSYIYYNFWETLGLEKRDLLKRNISQAQEAQKDSQEAFASTLDKIQALYGLEGGELESAYRSLSKEYEAAEEAANDLKERSASVQSIAQDLFAEWREEAESMHHSQMKNQSLARLKETEKRFQEMKVAMQAAEETMEPVLMTMRDHVLYLKHNLNAMALSSFKKEFSSIQSDIKKLIESMNRSIQQSDRFLQTLNS